MSLVTTCLLISVYYFICVFSYCMFCSKDRCLQFCVIFTLKLVFYSSRNLDEKLFLTSYFIFSHFGVFILSWLYPPFLLLKEYTCNISQPKHNDCLRLVSSSSWFFQFVSFCHIIVGTVSRLSLMGRLFASPLVNGVMRRSNCICQRIFSHC